MLQKKDVMCDCSKQAGTIKADNDRQDGDGNFLSLSQVVRQHWSLNVSLSTSYTVRACFQRAPIGPVRWSAEKEGGLVVELRVFSKRD